jgi:hypothetical protein
MGTDMKGQPNAYLSHTMAKIDWAVEGDPLLRPGYEVSSAGDQRFSALYARLPEHSGFTIEQMYQLGVKGYGRFGLDWRLGKGQPTLKGQTSEQLWDEYLSLWRSWAQSHPILMECLRRLAETNGNLLTDRFARGPINQAHALATILNGD